MLDPAWQKAPHNWATVFQGRGGQGQKEGKLKTGGQIKVGWLADGMKRKQGKETMWSFRERKNSSEGKIKGTPQKPCSYLILRYLWLCLKCLYRFFFACILCDRLLQTPGYVQLENACLFTHSNQFAHTAGYSEAIH